MGTVGLKPGNLVLVKADAFQGKRKIKDGWEDKHHEVVCQIITDVPSFEVKDQWGHSHTLHCNRILIESEIGTPLCAGVCQVWHRCTRSSPVMPTPKGSESETTPQDDNHLVITQHQPRKTFLGWINGKVQLFPSISAGASIEDG